MTERLCILTVHAHPDDEASKGAGTIARYQAEGVDTVLVCCTGGEEGEILNPAMDRPEIVDNLKQVRRDELERATKIIGYNTVHMLGYRDSGMPESDANFHPTASPSPPRRGGRPAGRDPPPRAAPRDRHLSRGPGHLPASRPPAGVGTSPCPRSRRRPIPAIVPNSAIPGRSRRSTPRCGRAPGLQARHDAFLEHGLESPYDEKWFERPDQDDRITAQVSIEGFAFARREGLLAHATQIDPDSKFWFGLPAEVDEAIHPWDDYMQIAGPRGATGVEDDLFAGLRSAAVAS